MKYSMQPLADKLRPINLDMVFGQKHLLLKNKPIRIMYEKKRLSNMIFYGPPGIGKTTVAMILAQNTGLKFYKINATNTSTKEIQEILDENKGNSLVLYVDEIQYFNKKQQQSLLEYIESGRIILIASTTENPAFYIYDALLSRCHVFEFKNLDRDDMKDAINAAINSVEDDNFNKLEIPIESIEYIIDCCDGDVRKAINLIELLVLMDIKEKILTVSKIAEIVNKKIFKHDKDGNNHYDVISAFQKSIRGSDPDAALHYLARLIVGGDIKTVCRRLLVIAAEDIGLANPQATNIVYGCTEAALKLGMPEARIPLAEATIYLATCPKSNSAIIAIDAALEDLNKGIGEIPDYLKDSHYNRTHYGPEYKYPHNYKNHYIKQQYIPDMYLGSKYYLPQENKFESAAEEYWQKIKE